MQSGQLRQRLLVQTKVETRDADGNVTITYADLATVWGQVAPLSGSKTVSRDRVEATTVFRIRMRYFAGLTASHRILFGTRVFQINALQNLEERGIEWVVTAIED